MGPFDDEYISEDNGLVNFDGCHIEETDQLRSTQ